jgi:uncharacterized protein involved in exopolysaccharide biosynthesis
MSPGVLNMRSGGAGLGGDWASRPRYAASDFATLLWRERFVMLAVFLLIFVAGAGFAFTLHAVYPAQASVLVRLGQEYVYQPRAGDAGRGAVPDVDQVVQSESEILSSDELKDRVIRRIGFARLFPALAPRFLAAGAAQREQMIGQARTAIGHGLGIGTTPSTSVIRVGYQDRNPVTAALVVNTLLDEYLVYRRGVLSGPSALAVGRERQVFLDRLATADAALNSFLTANQIGDFNAEKASLSQLQAQLQQQQSQVQTQLQERTGRLATLESQMAGVTPEIGLYHDADPQLSNRLTELRVQREQLLSRYRPDSQPVHDLDIAIAQLTEAQAQGRAQGESSRRIGVNPVYQTLQTDRIQLTAEVSALRASLANVNSQLADLTRRRLHLDALEPQFTALTRDRDVLQSNVRDFTVRAEESQASAAIEATSSDNIRIVARAQVPTESHSLKKPVFILSFLFAVFTAVCAGLLRMYLRPGLPTPAAAARTLGLPVLGRADFKSAA